MPPFGVLSNIFGGNNSITMRNGHMTGNMGEALFQAPAGRRSDDASGEWAMSRTVIEPAVTGMVDPGGFEPPTSSLRTKRATNCAMGP